MLRPAQATDVPRVLAPAPAPMRDGGSTLGTRAERGRPPPFGAQVTTVALNEDLILLTRSMSDSPPVAVAEETPAASSSVSLLPTAHETLPSHDASHTVDFVGTYGDDDDGHALSAAAARSNNAGLALLSRVGATLAALMGCRPRACISGADGRRGQVIFREFAPQAWAWLRQHVYGVSAESYVTSMSQDGSDGGPKLLRALAKFSEAKGGGFFFFSPDQRCGSHRARTRRPDPTRRPRRAALAQPMHRLYSTPHRYMVKSMTVKEHKTLLSILPGYCNHLRRHRESTITRIHGCYSITMYGQTQHFFVMENLFHGMPRMHEVYDLKGSWIDRHAKPGSSTRLDADWPPSKLLHVSANAAQAMLRQVCCDATFLRSCGIMDYSILLGIHHVTEQRLLLETDEPHKPPSFTRRPSLTASPSGQLAKSPSALSQSQAIAAAHQLHEGPHSYTAVVLEGPGLYRLGIIDLLQEWCAVRCPCTSPALPPSRTRCPFTRAPRRFLPPVTLRPFSAAHQRVTCRQEPRQAH